MGYFICWAYPDIYSYLLAYRLGLGTQVNWSNKADHLLISSTDKGKKKVIVRVVWFVCYSYRRPTPTHIGNLQHFRVEKSDATLNILRADYRFPVAHASPCAPRPLPLRTGRTVQTAAETCMHAPPPITAMCGPAWGVGEYTGGKRPV